MGRLSSYCHHINKGGTGLQLIKRLRIIPVDAGRYILLNGVNGSMEMIDESVYQVYLQWRQEEDIHPTPEQEAIYTNFKNHSYIMSPEEEEVRITKLFQKLDAYYTRLKPMVMPTFLLTYDCNFRCSYCYEKQVRRKGKEAIKQRISPEMVRGLFQYFTEHQYTIGDVVLFGGEPLLPENEDVVREVLDQAKARDLYVRVITNGYTLDTYAPLLSTVKLRSVQVTLDGDRERHDRTRFTARGEGTFDQILRGLEKASEYNLPIVLRCNVELTEEGQIEKVLQVIEDTGLMKYPNVRVSVATVAGGASEEVCGNDFWLKYLDKIDPYADHPLFRNVLTNMHHIAASFIHQERSAPRYFCCNAHLGQMVFDPWGDIYPCQSIVGDEEMIVGHYDANGIDPNERYAMWEGRTLASMEKCRECALGLFCGGGCAINSLHADGTMGPAGCEQMESLCTVLMPYLYRKFLRGKVD